ncbi:hypothetical protein RD792_017864 [Penstemon davidsonii]|uniref:SEP domain-containing protein n=1 Tax=Penstemon davidsonii TaxID=160366 RepID=A0ABR0DWN5_9LAMI|nr:hypothetical protein RD792_017864 [Penstemon davidsonii]
MMCNDIFVQSIQKSECPKSWNSADRRSSVHVNLIRRDEDCPEPEVRRVPFQGVGRTLGSSSSTEEIVSAPVHSAPTPSVGLVLD